MTFVRSIRGLGFSWLFLQSLSDNHMENLRAFSLTILWRTRCKLTFPSKLHSKLKMRSNLHGVNLRWRTAAEGEAKWPKHRNTVNQAQRKGQGESALSCTELPQLHKSKQHLYWQNTQCALKKNNYWPTSASEHFGQGEPLLCQPYHWQPLVWLCIGCPGQSTLQDRSESSLHQRRKIKQTGINCCPKNHTGNPSQSQTQQAEPPVLCSDNPWPPPATSIG